jgi:hypothetical protein
VSAKHHHDERGEAGGMVFAASGGGLRHLDLFLLTRYAHAFATELLGLDLHGSSSGVSSPVLPSAAGLFAQAPTSGASRV